MLLYAETGQDLNCMHSVSFASDLQVLFASVRASWSFVKFSWH